MLDYDVIADDTITTKGDLVHMALQAEMGPMNWQQTLIKIEWHEAMKEELGVIERNNNRELVYLPPTKQPINLKWIFKLKRRPNGSNAKHKARLEARGFLQRKGVDYYEIHVCTSGKNGNNKAGYCLASSNGWLLFQMDVKYAFLNGRLEEEVYVMQRPGFEVKGEE